MSDRNSLRTNKKAQNRCCNNLLLTCVCEMFDLGTSQRPVQLKTSKRFCRRAPRSCKQFLASSSSPGSSRRHVLRFRRMCFTQVSGIPGGICYFITNNGEYISNLKLHAIAVHMILSSRRGNDVRVISFHPVPAAGGRPGSAGGDGPTTAHPTA